MDNKIYRKGDKVTLEIADFNVAGRSVFTTRDGVKGSHIDWLDLSRVEVISHEPAPDSIKVGDRVRMKIAPTASIGTVKGIDGHEMWVKFDSETFSTTRAIANYERVIER